MGSALATGALPAPATAAAASTPSASALYQEAIATTRAWSVHYASASTQSKVTLLVSGDAGPASGTQTVVTGKGSLSDNATIVVIGGITFVKGNLGGLENLAGLSAAQATVAQGQWIQFATTNVAFAQVVAGVRSHDVAQELALKGPLSLGAPARIDGVCRRRHRRDPDLQRPYVPARRPLRPRPGHPRPRGGGLARRQGAAAPRPST